MLLCILRHVPLLYDGVCLLFLSKGVARIEKSNTMPSKVSVLITEKEKKLLDILREIGYGEVVVTIKGGIPVHIEEIKKSIKL